jgi:hypothetical protein
MRIHGMIVVLAAAVASAPSTYASFALLDATTDVDVPPEGNPTYDLGDYLTQQSDHTITVRKVDGAPPFGFLWRARNENTCNGKVREETSDILGGGWVVGYQQTFYVYNLSITGQLTQEGGFAVNSYTMSKQVHEPLQEFSVDREDSNAFQVAD